MCSNQARNIWDGIIQEYNSGFMDKISTVKKKNIKT